jgi:hypothetical protein
LGRYALSIVKVFLPVRALNIGNHHSTQFSIPEHSNIQQRRSENVKYFLYVFFWVIPPRLNFVCRRFGTLCLFHLHRQVGMKNNEDKKYFLLTEITAAT